MTDRVAGFVVTLERDIREDGAQCTVSAIKQIKGVVSVEPIVADPMYQSATNRARRHFLDRIYALYQSILDE